METKPCAREGCLNVITRGKYGPAYFAKVKYCSKSCGTRDRMAHGYNPRALLTPEACAKGAVAVGKIVGERRRRARVLTAVASIEPYITRDLREALRDDLLLKVKLILARAYRAGRKDECARWQSADRSWRRKRRSEAA